MADEIYINLKNAPTSPTQQLGPTGTFQQTYQGQRPASGTTPATRPAVGGSPSTYQANARGRTPVVAQTTYPFTYQAQGSGTRPTQGAIQAVYPYIARAQLPYQYPARTQYPFTYLSLIHI